jgi:hypothetical protein
MSTPQSADLLPVPCAARFSFSRRVHGATPDDVRDALEALDPEGLIRGLGPATLSRLGAAVLGMRGFPALQGPGISIPSTQQALVLRTDGADAGEALLRRRVGLDDGITNALFRLSTPRTGGYTGCPPVAAGGCDLRALQGPA